MNGKCRLPVAILRFAFRAKAATAFRLMASASPTAILGISAFYHDSAACVVVDVRIVEAAQEERFSRKKHDHRVPELGNRKTESGSGAGGLFQPRPTLGREAVFLVGALWHIRDYHLKPSGG